MAPPKKAEAAIGLAARIRETPYLSDAEAAKSRLTDLLKSDRKAAARLEPLILPKSKARALLEGVADGSSFLWSIVQTDPGILVSLLEAPPESSLTKIV